MFAVALIPAVIGWLLLGYVVLLVGMSADVACTAHRGDVYAKCVRSDDLWALRAQGWIMGLAMAAFALVLIGLVCQPTPRRFDPLTILIVTVCTLLAIVSIGGWVLGALGLWAPDRPYPYDPVSVAQGSATLLTSALVGLVVGALTGAAIRLAQLAHTRAP